MQRIPLTRWLATGLAALGVLAAPLAMAADYPQRTVSLVVPFPPGGATDALARLMAEKLSQKWGQTVLVENKPGGNTMVGTDFVAKSAPDGHVVGMVTGSHVINPLLTKNMPYDTARDLAPVMLLTGFPMAVYANPNFPANTPAEFVEYVRNSKEKIPYGSATTQSYLAMELLNQMMGTQMEYVPYKGSAQAQADLIGGHIPVAIDPVLLGTLEQVKAGRMKIIGTLGSEPAEITPGVPTFGAAVPGYDFSGAFGLITRAGTPPEVIATIRDGFAEVLAMPDVAERARTIGQEVLASTSKEYADYLGVETAKWQPIIAATGATLD